MNNACFVELNATELLYIDGGIDWIKVGIGAAAIAVSVVAIGASAFIGAGLGPGGAAAAAGACAKVTAPLWIGGAASVALGFAS